MRVVVLAALCGALIACTREPKSPPTHTVAQDARARDPEPRRVQDGGRETLARFIERVLAEADHLREWIPCGDDPACMKVERHRQACFSGEGRRCMKLSSAYMVSDGVPRDVRKAGDAAALGCQLGDREACVALGNAMDLDGYGAVDTMLSREIYDRECFDHDEYEWACFGVARWIAFFGGERADAIRALERGVAMDPTWDWLQHRLACMRANPSFSVLDCSDVAP